MGLGYLDWICRADSSMVLRQSIPQARARAVPVAWSLVALDDLRLGSSRSAASDSSSEGGPLGGFEIATLLESVGRCESFAAWWGRGDPLVSRGPKRGLAVGGWYVADGVSETVSECPSCISTSGSDSSGDGDNRGFAAELPRGGTCGCSRRVVPRSWYLTGFLTKKRLTSSVRSRK